MERARSFAFGFQGVLHLLVVVAALAHFLTVAAFSVPAANG